MTLLLLGCDENVKMEVTQDEYSDEQMITRSTDEINWDYPIKPGTEMWKSLESNEAKVKACQIPQNILESLSDSSLLELCINYPLINDLYAFQNYESGIDKLIKDFNGIREFFMRENRSKVLLSKFNDLIDNSSVLEKETSNLAQGEYIVLISTIELLLSRPEMHKGLAFLAQKDIMQELWRAYEMKIELSNHFQGLGFKTNLIARENIISIIYNSDNINPYKGSYDENYIEWVNEKTLEIIGK